MENEIWKPVVGYEGLYEVSNTGNVKSLGNKVWKNARILKPQVRGKSGYLFVRLSKDGQAKGINIHRLVAETFIPNPLNLPIVNHKDENIANCRADNLEWCTSKYNANYGTRNARMMVLRKTKRVAQRTKDGEFINCFKSIADAERVTGVDNTTITRACKGKQKTAGGFVWQYVD